jgi:hypothetical protein
MKFKTKTKMQTATWRDIEMADAQGTILSVHLNSFSSNTDTDRSVYYQSGRAYQERGDVSNFIIASGILGLSSILFGAAAFKFFGAYRNYSEEMEEPLVESTTVQRTLA